MEKWAVVLAGLANLGMVGVGLQVPRVFRWREDLANLRPLNRRIVWVQGAFVALINLAFGAISLAFPGEIASGRGVARALALFMGLYWGARLAVQYLVFVGPGWPAGAPGRLAKHGLAAVILFMSLVYLASFARGILS